MDRLLTDVQAIVSESVLVVCQKVLWLYILIVFFVASAINRVSPERHRALMSEISGARKNMG